MNPLDFANCGKVSPTLIISRFVSGVSVRHWGHVADHCSAVPVDALGLTTYIPAATVNAYFTLVLRGLGFSTFASNMLQIPHYALFMLNNWLISTLSRRVNERSIVASLAGWWQMLFLIVLVAIPNDTNQWAKYAILTLLVAYPYCHPSEYLPVCRSHIFAQLTTECF